MFPLEKSDMALHVIKYRCHVICKNEAALMVLVTKVSSVARVTDIIIMTRYKERPLPRDYAIPL